jgi:hypothetical protein
MCNFFRHTKFFKKHTTVKLLLADSKSVLTKIFISAQKFYIIMCKDSLISLPQNFLQ